MSRRRASRNRYLDWVGQLDSFLGGHQKSIDGWGCIEVSDSLLLQQLPNERVVNLSEAHI